ncbi:unnamed protein product [Brassica oleracea]
MTHEEFAEKHPHPPSPFYVKIDRPHEPAVDRQRETDIDRPPHLPSTDGHLSPTECGYHLLISTSWSLEMILATLHHAIVEQSTQNRSTLTLLHRSIPMSHRRPMNSIPRRSTGSNRKTTSHYQISVIQTLPFNNPTREDVMTIQ